MYAQIEKPKENKSRSVENKSRSVANSVAQKKSNVKQGFRFVDNRPESIIQRKLQKIDYSQKNVLQRYNSTEHGKVSDGQKLLLDIDNNLFAGDSQFTQAQFLAGDIGFQKGEAHNHFSGLSKVRPEIKEDSELYNKLQTYDSAADKESIEDSMKNDYPSIDDLKESILFDLEGAFEDFEGTEEDKITKFGTAEESELENIVNTTVDFILALTGGLASYDDSSLAASLRNYFSEIEQNENKIFTPTDCGQMASTVIGSDITTIAKDNPDIQPGSVYKYTPDLEKREEWEWDHHFAAIIMVDGPDHVTMENAAAKSSTKLSKFQFDSSWFFEMYGQIEGQTFKDKYKDDFGD